jgi:hypothetical protein
MDMATIIDVQMETIGALRLENSAAASHEGFASWRRLLGEGATMRNGHQHIGEVGFRDLHPEEDKIDVALWIGDSADAAVQINEPNDPETENGLAAIACDGEGRRYVLRQAWLKKNNASPAIRDGEFARLTGLSPVDVRRGKAKAGRQWHLVTSIDGVSQASVLSATAAFVERCWSARLAAAGIATLLEAISSASTEAALHYLLDQAQSAGFKFIFRKSKDVRGVEFQDATGRNLYSFTANREHLLFFLRRPAQKRATGLWSAAVARYGEQESNARGEYRVPVRTRTDAEGLIAWLQSIGAWHDIISPVGASLRLSAETFKAVTASHLLAAARRLVDGFADHPFGLSADYDVVFENKRLPPKALFGLAASEALGRDIRPEHFSGGIGTPCFRVIAAAGYPIVAKGEQLPAEPGLSDDDRQWTEGHKKLVTHLTRERGHGLSAAKRDQFKAHHGRLFCERCDMDPVGHYGSVDGEACIEVHHDKIAVADMQSGHRTALEDLKCLCANCHRIVHRELKQATMKAPSAAD